MMQNEANSLGEALESAELQAKYDAVCKELLSDKQILARILKTCAKEYRLFSIDEIINTIEGEPEVSASPLNVSSTTEKIVGINTEDTALNEGIVRYDILFRSKIPGEEGIIELIVNIEAQNKFKPGYSLVTRGIYYCSRLISRQKETEFFGSHYERIKKVYSIWICSNPSAEWSGTITSYSLQENNIIGNAHEKTAMYDKLQIILVCLGKEKSDSHLLNMLGDLLSDDLSKREKRARLENYNIKLTRQLEGRMSEMCNLSQGVLEKGLEKGLEQGLERKELENIKALMENMKISAEKAMELLNTLPENKAKYLEMLK